MENQLTISEAADRLHCSDRTVREYCQQGKIRAKKTVSRWLIDEDEVNRFSGQGAQPEVQSYALSRATDAITARALENHNNALLRMVAALIDEIRMPSTQECLQGHLQHTISVESAPEDRRLFADLREHLTGSDFGHIFDALEDIKRLREHYVRLHLPLLASASEDVKQAFLAEIDPYYPGWGWTDFFPLFVCMYAIENVYRKRRNMPLISKALLVRPHDETSPLALQEADALTFPLGLFGGETVIALSVREETLELCRKIYWKLTKNYQKSRQASDIVDIREKLEEGVSKLWDELRGLQIRGLIPGRCRDCPE